MEVALVDDHVSVIGWPGWVEAGEALRETLGDAGGRGSCRAAMGFFPLAISVSTTKPNKTPVRSECKRIYSLLFYDGAFTWGWMPTNVPAIDHKGCGMARRCKLFLGTECEQGALVQEELVVGPPLL